MCYNVYIMGSKILTEKQKAVYKFLKQETIKNGYQPNTEEMCAHFGIASTNGIAGHLRALSKKGYIKITGKSRALTLLK